MIIKNKKFNKINLILPLILTTLFIATPALAQTTTPTTTKTAANISRLIKSSDLAITKRINSLNALVTRVNSMQKLSAEEKNTLAASLQNEIGQLTSLETTIDAETTLSALKTDMQSITKSYRIYMLVLPQASIAAAADRTLTIVGLMNGVVTKLETRISQLAPTANTTSIQSLMSDIAAKLSDSTTQANAAVSETASLVPDQGNVTTAAANTAALKDARNKIKTATSDLMAARKDFTTIVKDLKNAKSTTTTSPAPQ